jgi:hypothetical protein
MSQPPEKRRRGLGGWLLVLGVLTLLGLLLALADIALDSRWLGPLATAVGGQSAFTSPRTSPLPPSERFDRSLGGLRFTFGSPFGPRGAISPLQAARALLSNGAGLILLALAALVLFPTRARFAVERLEMRRGPEIALAAGVATFLLALAAVILLRFTLVFLAVIPVVVVIVLGTAVFGMGCIALALGRLVQRNLRLGEAHPLIVALAGALIIFDLAVIPYAGIVALAFVAIGGLGLAVVTRFGSEGGWSFGDLSW